MRTLFILICTTLLTASAVAQQQNTSAAKGTITGNIVAEDTKQPIEFATISLHKVSDSSLVTGTTANAKGNFELENVAMGSYFIRAGFVGFKTLYQDQILVSKATPKVDLGVLALASSTASLQEVEVTAEKRQMETMIDKKIFNVDKTPAAAGGDGLEVLRNVPSVEVDVDGNISLRGESNVNILVDGRPMNMSASQFLQSVPATAIEKIELITNPSAKYDPEGTSGIINIIMKKDRAAGLNGNINSSMGYGKNPKSNNSLSLNYRKNKWNLQSSISANYNKFWFGGTNTRNVSLADTTFYQLTKDEGQNESLSLVGQLGADYYLSDNTTLYVSGTVTGIKNEGENEISYINANQAGEEGVTSDRIANSSNPTNAYAFNGGVQHKFNKKGHNLDLDLNYSNNTASTDERFLQTFVANSEAVAPDNLDQIQQNTEARSVFNSRLDYVNPINDSTTLEAGFHTTFRDFDNDQYFATQNDQGVYVGDENFNNRFLYSETVYALYGTFAKDLRKWTAKAGLRYEYTGTEGILVNTQDTGGVNYNSFFPSAYLAYKITPAKQVQLSYTRRINRPSEGQLNPFTSFSDPTTIRTGNPFLRPEYIDVMELGYNSYGKKVNINASIYGRQVNDRIGRFLQLDSSGTNVVLFRNFDKSYVYGAEFILGYNPTKNWRTRTTFNYWRTEFSEEGFVEENLNLTNYGYMAFFQSTHTFAKDWMIQWNVQYRGAMQVLQGSITPMYGVDLSARKQIWDKKAAISVRVSDIFNTREFGFESDDLGNYDFQTLRQWESMVAYVSFNYSFGKQDMSSRRRRNRTGGGGDRMPDTGF